MELKDNLTVCIKTFLRPESLARCVRSIRDNLGDEVRILVANDGDDSINNIDAEVIDLPFDSGIAVGRNTMLEHVDTEYAMFMDDDCILETGVKEPITLLESCIHIDIVAGSVKSTRFYGKIQKRENNIIKLHAKTSGIACNIPIYDFVPNFFIARADSIRAIGGWDEDLKLCEHLDFFWRAKHAGIKSTIVKGFRSRNEQTSNKRYDKFRKDRKTRFKRLLKKKLNVSEVKEASPSKGPEQDPNVKQPTVLFTDTGFRKGKERPHKPKPVSKESEKKPATSQASNGQLVHEKGSKPPEIPPIPSPTIGTSKKHGRYINASLIDSEPKNIKDSDLTVCFSVKSKEIDSVRKCLQSFRSQEQGYNDIKIIVCDCGSPKSYIKDLSKLCDEFDALLIQTKTKEFNKPLALWKCHQHINTEYVLYSDIDHIVAPNFVRSTLLGLEYKKNPMVLCKTADIKKDVYVKKENWEQARNAATISDGDDKMDYGAVIATRTDTIETVGGWNVSIPVCGHGQELYLRLLAEAVSEIWIDNITTVLHQEHGKNPQRTPKRRDLHKRKVDRVKEWVKNNGIALEKKLASVYVDDDHAKWLNNRPLTPDTTKKLSFLLPVRDFNEDILKKCLDHLNTQTYQNMEVVIVDFGSEEQYSKMLSQEVKSRLSNKKHSLYKAHVKDQPWSLSKALNICLDHASFENVVVWNADMVVKPNFAERLTALIKDNEVLSFTVRYLKQFGKDLFSSSSYYPYGLGISAGPKKLYRSIGGWDERMTGWGKEDNDMIRRLMLSGVKVKNAYPYCIPYHIEHERDRTGANQNQKILKDSDNEVVKSSYRENINVEKVI